MTNKFRDVALEGLEKLKDERMNLMLRPNRRLDEEVQERLKELNAEIGNLERYIAEHKEG